MKIILRLIIALLLVNMSAHSIYGATTERKTFTCPTNLNLVKEWEHISATDANIATMSKEQILAEIQKHLEAQKNLSSWETRYHITSRQAPRKERSIPEIITTSQVHIISNGPKWFYERKAEREDKTAKNKSTEDERVASNGKTVSIIWPEENTAKTIDADQYTVLSGNMTIADFLPWLPAQPLLSYPDCFPDFNDFLTSQDTKLLPWYTNVNGDICYVIEHVVTAQHPLFKTTEELDEWRKGHPKEVEAWEKLKTETGWLLDFRAKSGDVRAVKLTTQLAIDSKLGFAIVKRTRGLENETPYVHALIFPMYEMVYKGFQEINKEIYIPYEMTYTQYTFGEEQIKVHKETQLTVEEFTVNKQYQPEIFEPDFPKGCGMIDSERGISYTVGDSNDTINALAAAAKARKEFYKNLSQEQVPALEPDKWINSDPIVLAEQKGRPVILHFWSLGCRPCIAELPQLQKQYGHTVESSTEPLFISIHPVAGDQELSELKKVIKKHEITFPVMVDSGPFEPPFGGKTFKKYMVGSFPTDITIDETGHISKIPEDIFINANSWWIKNLQK